MAQASLQKRRATRVISETDRKFIEGRVKWWRRIIGEKVIAIETGDDKEI